MSKPSHDQAVFCDELEWERVEKFCVWERGGSHLVVSCVSGEYLSMISTATATISPSTVSHDHLQLRPTAYCGSDLCCYPLLCLNFDMKIFLSLTFPVIFCNNGETGPHTHSEHDHTLFFSIACLLLTHCMVGILILPNQKCRHA